MDAEWARLEPLIPKASPGGRPRKTDMRAAMNAILYLLRTGCSWRCLPRDSFHLHPACSQAACQGVGRELNKPPVGNG
jgi:transposase